MDTRPIINGEELNLDDTTVFLGITMDSKLQWSPHINGLAKRLSSAAYAVKKIRSLTDVDTARLVYFSYFHSLMTYGLLLWGHAADVETIFILQKRAIRAIYNLKWIVFFNKIPEALLSLPFNKFKKCIKEKLCKKAYYKVNDYLADKRAWD
ncbi:unnamed protein product [Pieris macdunnoughi]|uniref:RNA-directed DNA polymerase from transposon BS n=1 Tax=Pieris macdunnoughi TaxID=345717 RepID=A0A821XRY2_9NEOP|nr:unnamed protein product [Pieris macdunnoughi]